MHSTVPRCCPAPLQILLICLQSLLYHLNDSLLLRPHTSQFWPSFPLTRAFLHSVARETVLNTNLIMTHLLETPRGSRWLPVALGSRAHLSAFVDPSLSPCLPLHLPPLPNLPYRIHLQCVFLNLFIYREGEGGQGRGRDSYLSLHTQNGAK